MIALSHEQSKNIIQALEPHLHIRHYHAGQVLWHEGDVSGRMVVMDRGRVKALRTLPDGTSTLLFVFTRGDLFGFLPFVDGGVYPATSIAVDDVETREMSRSELQRIIQKDSQLTLILLTVLGKRFRQACDRLLDQAQRSSLARVAATLLLLLPEANIQDPTTIIDIPSPIHEFAADIGITPETFSRAVTKLVEKDVIHRLASPKLQVLDIRGLQDIAAGREMASKNS